MYKGQGQKMKSKILLAVLSMLPFAANAAIPYRVEQVKMPVPETPSGYDDEAFARVRRFYVGGAYNLSVWNDWGDGTVGIDGKTTSGFDVSAGVRAYDIFRVEANYIYANAKWNDFSLTGNVAMLNAIFDARIDNIYRLFYNQRIVPYVGFGVGASWNTADGTTIDSKVSPVVAALAGVGIEMGERFAVDIGYRYMYMFSPKFSAVDNLAPAAHQLRVGARVNF